MNYHALSWVILEIRNNGEVFHKLLATTGRGMNDWRINSGIVEIIEDKDAGPGELIIVGESGSYYSANRENEELVGAAKSFWDHEISDETKLNIAIVKLDSVIDLYK